jgi:SAM-dependent methyltransferase
MNKNIKYETDEISNYYSSHRGSWKDFYTSERHIIRRAAGRRRSMGKVLDVGCAAGGLEYALKEKFKIEEYFGVDINEKCIETAKENRTGRKKDIPVTLICEDIMECKSIPYNGFDNVFSLSCADWNVRTLEILQRCWEYVQNNGNFILTLRLTNGSSASDISESFQYISFGEKPLSKKRAEKAPYVVFNVRDALRILAALQPKPIKIFAYGYWGSPSKTAVTPYARLVFTAFAMRKSNPPNDETEFDCRLPLTVFSEP